MKPIVADTAFGLNKKLEGCIDYMYLDVKGLVTIGIGNLIDPVSEAIHLPFIHKSDNSPANSNDIILEWRKIKLNTQLAHQGHIPAAKLTNLKLTYDSICKLCTDKLALFEQYLKRNSFKNFDSFPADAQLGIFLMAWAVGAGFPKIFVKFSGFVTQEKWDEAAKECYINTKNNPGLIPRNKIVKNLFLAAQHVKDSGLNPDNIYGVFTRLWFDARRDGSS